jgi:hypothetical protein
MGVCFSIPYQIGSDIVLWMASPLPQPAPPHLCAICGKPVDLKTCKTDADGHTVHSECINGKVIEISRKKAQGEA